MHVGALAGILVVRRRAFHHLHFKLHGQLFGRIAGGVVARSATASCGESHVVATDWHRHHHSRFENCAFGVNPPEPNRALCGGIEQTDDPEDNSRNCGGGRDRQNPRPDDPPRHSPAYG